MSMKYENRLISEEQKRIYANVERNGAVKYIDKYLEYFNILAKINDLTIVDIGGGSGYFAHELWKFFNANRAAHTQTSITVIDCCEYDEWKLFPNIDFVKEFGLVALEKIADNSVDALFLNLTLHHLTMDTYKKTRQHQYQLLEIAYQKLKPGGYVFINECYYQNPIIRDFSIPIVYYMSSSKSPAMIKLSRALNSKSAGVGVCFLSSRLWEKTFSEIGFTIIYYRTSNWRWVKKPLIREKFFHNVLQK